MNADSQRINVACRICGEAGPHETYVVNEMMFGSREPFDYFRCSKCGCLQIVSIPNDLARHYPLDYYSQAQLTEPAHPGGVKGELVKWYCRSAITRPKSRWRARLRSFLPTPSDYLAVEPYLKDARLDSCEERILDVGCGASPTRLAAMRRCGFFNVEGVDPFLPRDLVYHGVPVRKQTIDEVRGVFGLVMFHHSLEHVLDPLNSLREAARLLRPKGCCLVRVPVMGTHFWNRFGVNWAEIDAPRHLHVLSERSIDVLAQKAGFKVRSWFFDSAGWEIAASIQYEAGMPMSDPRSFQRGAGNAFFNHRELAAFDREARELNKSRDGGRACFFLDKD